jgi:hypothetical protein
MPNNMLRKVEKGREREKKKRDVLQDPSLLWENAAYSHWEGLEKSSQHAHLRYFTKGQGSGVSVTRCSREWKISYYCWSARVIMDHWDLADIESPQVLPFENTIDIK